MKNTYIVLFLMLFTCNNDSKVSKIHLPKRDVTSVLNKEEKLIELYNSTVIPLFSVYNDIEVPTEFQIIEEELGVDAGASFGYIEVSAGLINLKEECIQLFALTHEVAHIATLSQARLFNLNGYVSNGPRTNEYRKSEYLADLITIHLIKLKEPKYFEELKVNFDILLKILGNGTITHPSGVNRIKLMHDYIALSNSKNETIAFQEMYLKIWEDTLE